MKYTTTDEISSYYYKYVYNMVFSQANKTCDLLAYFERFIEKESLKHPKNILEIGGGGGQHLRFVKNMPSNKYVILDLRTPSKKIISSLLKNYPEVIFQKGSVEQIPFNDYYFDQIKSTCVLAHVQNPLLALSEIKRVTKQGGQILLLLPTDPGLFNLFLKKIYTYRKINKISILPAELIYAIEHKNPIGNLLNLVNYVFRNDFVKIKYLPFRFHSTNLNLAIIVKIKII